MNKTKHIAWLVIGVLLIGSSAFADNRNTEQQIVGQVIKNFWWSAKKRDWRGMTKRLHFPFVARGQQTVIYRSARSFERTFVTEKDISQGMDRYLNSIRISHIKVTVPSSNLAYASYTFSWDDKVPTRLTSRLRKFRSGWKIVYSAMPG